MEINTKYTQGFMELERPVARKQYINYGDVSHMRIINPETGEMWDTPALPNSKPHERYRLWQDTMKNMKHPGTNPKVSQWKFYQRIKE